MRAPIKINSIVLGYKLMMNSTSISRVSFKSSSKNKHRT